MKDKEKRMEMKKPLMDKNKFKFSPIAVESMKSTTVVNPNEKEMAVDKQSLGNEMIASVGSNGAVANGAVNMNENNKGWSSVNH